MKTISYTVSRKNYAEAMDAVVVDRAPTIITRAGHESVVMMSVDDYNSQKETAYLLGSPNNARRLLDSIPDLEANRGQARELLGDE